MWHDGSKNKEMKFVMRDCRFDGVEGWRFARHHHDAQFFFLNCTFAATMRDLKPKRVIYPLNGGAATEADIQRNQAADPTNIWGERFYYFNCHRKGGDYAWHQDNVSTALNAPKPEAITAVWTFGGTWDPERTAGPTVVAVARKDDRIRRTNSPPSILMAARLSQPKRMLHCVWPSLRYRLGISWAFDRSV
jgi:pectinesterase